MNDSQASAVAAAWQERIGRAPVGRWWTTLNHPVGEPDAAAQAFGRQLAKTLPDLDAWLVVDHEGLPSVIGLDGRTMYEARVVDIVHRSLQWQVAARELDVTQLIVTRETLVAGENEALVRTVWSVSLDAKRRLTLNGEANEDGPANQPERLGWAFAKLVGWPTPWKRKLESVAVVI